MNGTDHSTGAKPPFSVDANASSDADAGAPPILPKANFTRAPDWVIPVRQNDWPIVDTDKKPPVLGSTVFVFATNLTKLVFEAMLTVWVLRRRRQSVGQRVTIAGEVDLVDTQTIRTHIENVHRTVETIYQRTCNRMGSNPPSLGVLATVLKHMLFSDPNGYSCQGPHDTMAAFTPFLMQLFVEASRHIDKVAGTCFVDKFDIHRARFEETFEMDMEKAASERNGEIYAGVVRVSHSRQM